VSSGSGGFGLWVLLFSLFLGVVVLCVWVSAVVPRGTVRLTMIMIYFTKVNTRCSGHARCISWQFVFALVK